MLSGVTRIREKVKGEMEGRGDLDLGQGQRRQGGEDNGGVSSTSTADPYGFSHRNASTRAI